MLMLANSATSLGVLLNSVNSKSAAKKARQVKKLN
jgi:hypothetical protein